MIYMKWDGDKLWAVLQPIPGLKWTPYLTKKIYINIIYNFFDPLNYKIWTPQPKFCLNPAKTWLNIIVFVLLLQYFQNTVIIEVKLYVVIGFYLDPQLI